MYILHVSFNNILRILSISHLTHIYEYNWQHKKKIEREIYFLYKSWKFFDIFELIFVIHQRHTQIHKQISNILKVIDCLVVYFKNTAKLYVHDGEKKNTMHLQLHRRWCVRNKMHDFHSFLKNADFSIYVFHSLDKRKAGISYGMNVSCYIIPTEYNVTSITYGGVVYCLKFFFIKRVQYNRNNNSTIIYVGAANNFSLVNFNHLEKLGWCFYSNFPENCCIINWLLLKNRW